MKKILFYKVLTSLKSNLMVSFKRKSFAFGILLGFLIPPLFLLLIPNSWNRSRIKQILGIDPKIPGFVVDNPNRFSWYKPSEDHTIKTKKELRFVREKLYKKIVNPNLYEVKEINNWKDNTYSNFENLSEIKKIDFIHNEGVNSYSYLFIPKKINNRLLIFNQGHTGSFKNSKETLNFFNSKGYHILAYQMPLLGSNPGILNSRGELQKHHELLIKFNTDTKSFIYLFTTPIVLGIDHISKNMEFDSISMVGISGGGWTTVLASAVDLRINYSFPVSGSLPLALRTYDIGDIENFHKPFYSEFSYLDLYLLGSTGKKRAQVQMNILRDNSVYSGGRSILYSSYISNLSENLGGKFLTNIFDGELHKIYKEQYELIHSKISSWTSIEKESL